MKQYDLLVIGFGKAGKTIAGKMASLGKKVALVERDASMYGGTCINIGCIPTKTLIHAAEENLSFAQAMELKETVTTRLRNKNEAVLTGAGVDLYNAQAKFVSNKVVEISAGDDVEQLTAENIVINTGAVSNVFPIPGLLESKNVVDSTGIQNLDQQPKRLGIIGGGNIGLEFASLYARLDSQVTVFEAAPAILGRAEEVAAKLAQTYLEEDGVSFVLGAKVEKVANAGEAVVVTADGKDYEFDAVMYAMGRKPATEGLGLENTDITLTERGAVQVNEYLETSVAGVYAAGDVNGGLQFTYTSLDDFRILLGQFTGNSDYNLNNRKNVPNTTFIEPALSQVGLTEKEVIAAGLPYKANELAVANMPRAHVNNDLRGIYKVIVNTETNEILGATLFGSNSHEIINLIKMAMDNKIPYTYIKNQVFTHPTMAENLNDVFNF
ncbi:FAD-containing oxidoreductase [Streptococcus loxodontisalivarius]|uniref:Pyruvate/2-oxoglutarate dehydrogenase complex dihydrolipoamide dehydrogenase (E3) component n=1 Tax=Streptococcus loxodontisalivarius TaxID=1349415 RepID=A0ABS2PR30_9STRE|nr:FAD-containing oxidoreductase [Streptococcus loxodontisalivarius]MBM7642000.1 pyruvate/2-oxoglutarate dehydrogenase complex dihydrolipoamide dehydrogenase (E3) component [Streptococcus loxodontisalivarius]